MNNVNHDEYPDNTDHQMTVLIFELVDGQNEIGMIHFYVVHAN